MSDLTPKQLAFVDHYVKHGDATAAYRSAYDTSRMKPASVTRKAFDVLHSVNVSSMIKAAREEAAAKIGVSLFDHLMRLQDLSAKAEKAGQFASAIRGEELRGKASNLYVERVEQKQEIKLTGFRMVSE